MAMLNKRQIKQMCSKEYWEGAVLESNNYGEFEVVEYTDSRNVLVRFLDTGYEITVTMSAVKGGNIKDRLRPYKYGVGYIGVGPYISRKGATKELAYSVWGDMLKRCYDEKYLTRFPTYRGCTVEEEWHNYQNFAKWFEDNYIEGYQLDKDIKVEGNRVYGTNVCSFVNPQENTEAAVSKHYKFVNPKGDVVELFNLSKFCRDNNLSLSCMYRVKDGIRPQYKGWTKYKEENDNAKT